MNWEPCLYLREYRAQGYDTRLLKKYLVENELVGSNKYVYYNAGTDVGEHLIKRFSMLNHEFSVLKVDDQKYIILKDSRF